MTCQCGAWDDDMVPVQQYMYIYTSGIFLEFGTFLMGHGPFGMKSIYNLGCLSIQMKSCREKG